MADKEGGFTDLSSNQKALIVAIVVAAVAGVLYFSQQYRFGGAEPVEDPTSTYTEDKKMEVLYQLEATREEPLPSEEEKMRILDRLQQTE